MASCPNCGEELKTRPKARKKCPHCKKYIYVRKGKLLSEEEREIQDYLKRLVNFNVSRRQFDQARQRLSERFGARANVRDTIWAILNSLLAQSRKQQYQKQVYHEMASMVSLEGKDPSPYLIEANKIELLDLKSKGTKSVTVQTVRDEFVCSYCQKLHGQKLDIDMAIENMPIPGSCEAEFGCRCFYSPYVNPIEGETDMSMLDQAIQAAKSKDRDTARRLLAQVVKEEPNNETAWTWLVYCAKSTSERKRYLEKVLEINPANLEAQEALEKLEKKAKAAKEKEEKANSTKGIMAVGGACAIIGLLVLPLWLGLIAAVCGLAAWSMGNRGGITLLLLGIIEVALYFYTIGAI